MKGQASSDNKTGYSLQAFFDLLEGMDGKGVASIAYEDFKTNREVINFNIDLYDNFHGRNGWHYNLLTGKIEKIY
jgi:hypothetical protein